MSPLTVAKPPLQISNEFVHIKVHQQSDRLSLTLASAKAGGANSPILERTGQSDHSQGVYEWVQEAQVETFTGKRFSSVELHHPFEGGSYHCLLFLPHDSAWVHIHETLAADDQTRGMAVQRFEAIWRFLEWHEPGEVFSPHLAPEAGDLIGRHVMRSPVLTAQCGRRAAALVRDMDELAKSQLVPAAMNLLRQEQTPVFYTGLRPHRVRDHVYFAAESTTARPALLFHSYYLWVSSTAEPGEALRQGRKKVWAASPAPHLSQRHERWPEPTEYAEQIYPLILRERWIESRMDGRTVGAVRLDRSYRNDVWFCAWFNSLRTSYGLYLWGRFLNRAEWMEKAASTRDLLASAPQDKGLYPTVFVFGDKPYWQHSHHQGGGPGIYHLFDMSWTVYQLLRWHRDIEPHDPSIAFAKEYCRGILRLQQADGSLPAYVDAVTHAPVQQVDHKALLKDLQSNPPGDSYIPYMLKQHWTEDRFLGSAEDSASLLCLAELAFLLPDEDALRSHILAGAKKIAGFLAEKVIPESAWLDFEVYYSCSPKSLLFYDHRSGQRPQNTLCMHMAAAGLLRLYETTAETAFLSMAERVWDRLCLYQQVWDPYFLSLHGFGGYGVMNTDGEWNDARQAQFSDTHLDFYRVVGDEEQRQRGCAACRAGFATVFLPQNHRLYPVGWWRQPRGQAAENHGHSGWNQLCGVSGFDWGSGSALASAAYYRLHEVEL